VADGWFAFRAGLAQVRRYWPLLVILLLINILSAALLTILPAVLLYGGANPTALQRVSEGDTTWLLVEQFSEQAINDQVGPAYLGLTFGQELLLTLITLAATLPVAWLSAAFFTGGVLHTYAQQPATFGWRQFLSGSWHWFSAFLLLGLIEGLLFLVIGLPLVIWLLMALSTNSWLVWILVPLTLLLGVTWLVVIDLTGAYLILKGTRNIFRAFGATVRFVVRHPLQILSLYGTALLLVVLINLAYHFGLLAVIPLTWWPLLFLAWQSFLILELSLRLTRWAAGLVLITPPPSLTLPEASE
jgi:hypothetical protein